MSNVTVLLTIYRWVTCNGISVFCAVSQRALKHTQNKIQNILVYPPTNKTLINQEQIFFQKAFDIQHKVDVKVC